MSGVGIACSLLLADSDLTAQVPATRIYSGPVPLEVALPAISIVQISGQQNNNAAMSTDAWLVKQRVQVTVFAEEYETVKTVLDLVRSALPLSRGTVNSFNCQGVIPDTEGPDLYDQETETHMQSQDYMISFTRTP